MILAGDIGGTKTHLALFDRDDVRRPVHLATYGSREHAGLEAMIEAFLSEHPAGVRNACFGVAGPVRDGRTESVNLAWMVDSARIAELLGLPRVGLINDLEANARGIAALGPDDFAVLNEGDAVATGNRAVISAGTGLGEGGLYWDGERHRPFASEGGHADFAPRSELEIELYRFLAAEHEHVSYERVCSGMGIANIFRFLLHAGSLPAPAWYREPPDPAAIASAALEGRDETASRTLDLFSSIYGAKAGNLALTLMATGGVYLGGGIAPKILPKLEEGAFMRAFVDKGRLSGLLEQIPVRVILNDRTALLGAALCATG